MNGHLLTLLLFGVVIAANNLVVSLALGAMGRRDRFLRIILSFAFFEFTIPLGGVWLGRKVSETLSLHASWLGPAILAGLGAFMMISAGRSGLDRAKLARAVTSWKGLIALSAGLSVDNLVAGFGLGMRGVPPLAMAVTIMGFSVVFSFIGLRTGHLVKRDYEKAGTAATGALLIALAGASIAGWI